MIDEGTGFRDVQGFSARCEELEEARGWVGYSFFRDKSSVGVAWEADERGAQDGPGVRFLGLHRNDAMALYEMVVIGSQDASHRQPVTFGSSRREIRLNGQSAWVRPHQITIAGFDRKSSLYNNFLRLGA